MRPATCAVTGRRVVLGRAADMGGDFPGNFRHNLQALLQPAEAEAGGVNKTPPMLTCAACLKLPGGTPRYGNRQHVALQLIHAALPLPSVCLVALELGQWRGQVRAACPPWGLALSRLWRGKSRRRNTDSIR